MKKLSLGLVLLSLTNIASAQEVEGAISTNSSFLDPFLQSSWPVMSFMLGLIDGFNPCAMWTLFVLIGFLLSVDSKLKRWAIGSVFIGTSGIIYLAALTAYLVGFTALSRFAGMYISWFFLGVGVVALVTGIMTIRASKTVGIECEVRDASSRAKFGKKMKEVLSQGNIWFVFLGVTLLAFSVNAFELLCSFAIPTAFTGTLVKLDLQLWEKVSALLLYDFAYILDDVIVFAIAMKTMSLTHFSPKIVQRAHLIGGVFLALLGAGMILDFQWFNVFESVFGVGFLEKMVQVMNDL